MTNLEIENNSSELKDKTLALFFTEGVSLKIWYDIGSLEREVALYNKMSKYLKKIYFFTYGDKEDLKFKDYLAKNIEIIPKKHINNNFFYSLLLPLIHRKILNNTHFNKTNQMWGSWSAIISKYLYKNKLIIRTGYMLSKNFKTQNPKSYLNLLINFIERIAYKSADATFTSSKGNFVDIEEKFKPKNHFLMPNYIEINKFKKLKVEKQNNSICFVGRLIEAKNLFNLLDALKELPYSLTIIGSGILFKDLKIIVEKNKLNVNFLGNIPNSKLPKILNIHEMFILPSLYENMPKSLLEAMACGLPVIGTNVRGINEVITHGINGILCNTDSKSIKDAIIYLFENEELKNQIGNNAREEIINDYSLEELFKKELKIIEKLVE